MTHFLVGSVLHSIIIELFSGKDSVLKSTETKDSEKIPHQSAEAIKQIQKPISEHANLGEEAQMGHASVEHKPIAKV